MAKVSLFLLFIREEYGFEIVVIAGVIIAGKLKENKVEFKESVSVEKEEFEQIGLN